MDLHSIVSSFSYPAIFILMLTNGIMNFPSSQFLYIICGYFVSTGHLTFIHTVIAGSIGNAIGNYITYSLVKKYDRPLARKLLMLDEATFEKVHSVLHSTFTKRGLWYIFIGKLTPSVKAFIPVVAGLAHTNRRYTAFIFFLASIIWATVVVSIGYFFGEHVSFSSITAVSLLVGGTILFLVYRTMSKKLHHTK